MLRRRTAPRFHRIHGIESKVFRRRTRVVQPVGLVDFVVYYEDSRRPFHGRLASGEWLAGTGEGLSLGMDIRRCAAGETNYQSVEQQ